MPRSRDRAAAPLRKQVCDPDLEVLGHGLLDVVDRDLAIDGANDVLERFLGQIERDLAPMERRVGKHLLQGALEFADVGAQVLGDHEGDFVVEHDVLGLGLLLQDGDPHLGFGRLDLHGQAPVETGDQAILQP